MKTILVLSACLAYLALAQGRSTGIAFTCDGPSSKVSEFRDILLEYYRDAEGRIIFPGTKWCGEGDEAEHDDDLGSQVEVDKCCRAHDWCDDIIPAGESKYGLTNDGSYTKLHCKCDCTFKKCLKDTDTFVGWMVGTGYFDVVPTKCYKKEHPITKCLATSGSPLFRCLAYEVDTSKPEIYQWFDVPLY